jgi:hypothetical protein
MKPDGQHFAYGDSEPRGVKQQGNCGHGELERT